MRLFSCNGTHIKDSKRQSKHKDLMKLYAKHGHTIDFTAVGLCESEFISVSNIAADDIVKCYAVFFDKNIHQSICFNPCIIGNIIQFTQATNRGLVTREEEVDMYGTYFVFFTQPQSISER